MKETRTNELAGKVYPMTLNEALQVVASAAADLGYGREDTDPKQMRIALVVMLVALRDTESIVIAADDEQDP